jgi:hypothetical protein
MYFSKVEDMKYTKTIDNSTSVLEYSRIRVQGAGYVCVCMMYDRTAVRVYVHSCMNRTFSFHAL